MPKVLGWLPSIMLNCILSLQSEAIQHNINSTSDQETFELFYESYYLHNCLQLPNICRYMNRPLSTVTHKWSCWAIVTIPFVWSLQNFSLLKPILGKFGLMASWLKYTESMNKWVQMVMKQCNVVITDMRAQLIFVWEFPWYQSVTLTFIYCYPFRSEKLLHISVLKL